MLAESQGSLFSKRESELKDEGHLRPGFSVLHVG